MKAAIYARVSTSDQHNEIQIRELKEYLSRRGWELAGVYEDEMSGAKTRRPGLDRLMEDARLHRFDVIVVWKLDRFGRSLIDLVMSENQICLRLLGLPLAPKPGVTRRYVAENRFLTLS